MRILFIVFLFLMSCSKGSFFGELITQSKSPTNQKIKEFEEPEVTSSFIKKSNCKRSSPIQKTPKPKIKISITA